MIDAEIAKYDAENEQENYFSFVKQLCCLPVKLATADDLEQGSLAMMNGDVLLLLDGCRQGFIIDAKGFPHRSIGTSQNEMVLRGPQEGVYRNAAG